ncbi:hypothetical protein FRB90_003607 [Tulasnella sp. 427]|nr:hypothetical protein FRB90_003607 [Tulasnella sp. 427]
MNATDLSPEAFPSLSGRTTIPKIYALPTELLQELIGFSIADIRHGPQPWTVYKRLAQLRLVSTHWLFAIDSQPSFWTYITNHLSPPVVSIVIQKSGSLPLDIDISTFHYHTTPIFRYINTVIRLADRWRSLTVQWFPKPEEEDVALENLLLTPAPRLQEFSFDGYSHVPSTINLFDNVAPNLDSITTRLVMPSWNSFLMIGLRKLSIIRVEAELSDLKSLSRVLAVSPRMEELEIVGWIASVLSDGLPLSPSPIALDYLRSFALYDLPEGWANALLETIRIPSACTIDLKLDTNSSGEALHQLARHLPARLTESSSLQITVQAYETYQSIAFRCDGNETTGGASIEVGNIVLGTLLLSPNVPRFWGNTLAQVSTHVKASGVPVALALFSSRHDHPDYMKSAYMSIEEHLPSVAAVALDRWSLQSFLQYETPTSFPNLYDIILTDPEGIPLEEILAFASARTGSAFVNGTTALRSVSLPRRYVDQATLDKLSDLVQCVYLR